MEGQPAIPPPHSDPTWSITKAEWDGMVVRARRMSRFLWWLCVLLPVIAIGAAVAALLLDPPWDSFAWIASAIALTASSERTGMWARSFMRSRSSRGRPILAPADPLTPADPSVRMRTICEGPKDSGSVRRRRASARAFARWSESRWKVSGGRAGGLDDSTG